MGQCNLRKVIFILLAMNLSLFNKSLGQQLAAPTFSHQAGYYTDSIVVELLTPIEDAIIRYTTNGSDPDLNSTLYTNPIIVRNKSQEPNSHSLIPTNPSFHFPINDYDETRANTRGWLAPYTLVNKATVIKARSFKLGYEPSPVQTATYFIDSLVNSRYSLPVVSISMDSSHLFSNEQGLFVYGFDTLSGGNYNQDNEYQAHLEWFSENGIRLVSQTCGAQNHGGGGRSASQKTLRLSARDIYGLDRFYIDAFDNNQPEHKHLIFRNHGHRPDCFPRDNVACDVVNALNLDSKNNKNVVLFLNGEYWGFYTVKEHLDDHYFSEKYHTQKENIVILSQSGSVQDGTIEDEIHYDNLLQFVSNNDIAIHENYEFVQTQMDADNFIDYNASQIFFGNGDWPISNVKFWRFRRDNFEPNAGIRLDGRWRWIFFDLDAGFGGDCSGIYHGYNSLIPSLSESGGSYTLLMRKLIENGNFKTNFINRSADLMNTAFKTSRVSQFIQQTETDVDPEMPEHVNRWRYPALSNTLLERSLEIPSVQKWNVIQSGLHNFAILRPKKLREYYMNYFELGDTSHITLNVNNTEAGRVKINSITIDENTLGIEGNPYPWNGIYFHNIPISLKAIARPGYRFSHWENTTIVNPDTIIYLTQDTSFTAVFDIDTTFTAYQHVYINELCASNTSFIADEYGEFDDWFELYNPNNYPVDLSEYYITDNLLYKTKFQIQSGDEKTIIPAHGYKLIWCDEVVSQGPLHANFKLSSSGESLALTMPDGISLIDSIVFNSQPTNQSFGRQIDGNETWTNFIIPTPNATNEILTDIATHNTTNPLLVYPNPGFNADKIYLSTTEPIKIFNALGKMVLESKYPVNHLSVANLASGVYLICTPTSHAKWVKL